MLEDMADQSYTERHGKLTVYKMPLRFTTRHPDFDTVEPVCAIRTLGIMPSSNFIYPAILKGVSAHQSQHYWDGNVLVRVANR